MIQVFMALPIIRESALYDRRLYAHHLQSGEATGDRWEDCPVDKGPVAFIGDLHLRRFGPRPGDDAGALIVPYMDMSNDWEEVNLADVLGTGQTVLHARGEIVLTADGPSIIAHWADGLLGLAYALLRPFTATGDPSPVHWFNPPTRYFSEESLTDEIKDMFLAGLKPGQTVPSPDQLDGIAATIIDEVRADAATINVPEGMREQVVRLAEQDAERQGRNERCNCGYFRKYKHCCINRN